MRHSQAGNCRPAHQVKRTLYIASDVLTPSVDNQTGAHMARFVVSQDILEVRLLGRMNGQRLMNVLHYRLGVDGASVLEGDDVITAAATSAFENAGGILQILKAISNPAWTYEGALYQWIYTTRYTAVRRNNAAGPGSFAGTALPPNVSSTITKQSVHGTRHGIGSIHIGGMGLNDITVGMLTVARVENLAGLAELLTVDIPLPTVPNALELTPIILNKASPQLSLTWHTATIQNESRVQRRRTVGLGE